MDNEGSKVFFIVNKYSGTHHKADFEALIAQVCKENGSEWTCAYTEAPAHACTLAAEAVVRGFSTVVAVGGDGTVNEVAQGLLHTPAAMGIIPKGSGNGLARHLGIPLRTVPAIRSLFTSSVIQMDTFRINGRLSLNVSGIGFDGYVAQLFGKEKTRGLQGYVRLALNEFVQYREFEAQIMMGNDLLRRSAFVIAIANSSQYGNNAKIAPAASVRDGLLNISILKKIPAYRLDFIYSLFSGKIDQSPCCEALQVRNTRIQLDAPAAYHVDGEPAGTAASFNIEIIPASLNILAPRESFRL